jgi:hypothetical protein
MNRFSIGFTDSELLKLEEMRFELEGTLGIPVSRAALIKRLLFGTWRWLKEKSENSADFTDFFKSSSKEDNGSPLSPDL